jgi:hypothetical protein
MSDLPTLAELETGSLLPRASGIFERVISAAQVQRYAATTLVVATIRTLWDPWKCPSEHLPLLAWAWSVDIWNDAWPLDRKRAVVAEARAFHERKTTIAGFRLALGYVDAELVRANLPRDGFFAGRAPTPAEHDSWLATLPEIRIHETTPRTRPGFKGFYCGRRGARAIDRAIFDRRRAVLIRDGVETELVFSGLTRASDGSLLSEPEKLLIPAAPKEDAMRAGGFVGSFVPPSTLAGQRVISLSFTKGGDAFLPNAVSPSLKKASVAPKRVAEARPAGLGFFANRPRYRRGVRVNDAQFAFYWSIRLADGSSPNLSRMRNVIGKTRLRREGYTAGLLVHAPRAPLQSSYPPGRVARLSPAKRVAELEHAIAVAQAARDVMFMDINSTRSLAFADLENLPNNARYGLAVRT